LRAAQAKASAAAQARPGAFVLGADTVVALEGEILGKPRDRQHALDMLLRLSGKSHEVISACCCWLPDGTMRHTAGSARVHFFPWPQNALEAYAATDEVLDKAGAYAIQGQGAFLAERIEGSVSAVVGLPMTQLVAMFLELGVIRAHESAISRDELGIASASSA
jgi:septum formation protein